MIGEVGEVAGRRDGLVDGGLADINQASRDFDFATDIVNAVSDVHGYGEVSVKPGHVEVMDRILQVARRFAGGLDLADIGHGNGAIFHDGLLVWQNFDRQAAQGHDDGVTDMEACGIRSGFICRWQAAHRRRLGHVGKRDFARRRSTAGKQQSRE